MLLLPYINFPDHQKLTPNRKFKHIRGSERHELRVHLHAVQEGLCVWCKNPMLLINFSDISMYKYPTQGKARISDDAATFEHMYDRWTPKTGKDDRISTIKLSCYKCNNDRSAARMNTFLNFAREQIIKYATDKNDAKRKIKSMQSRTEPNRLYSQFIVDKDDLIKILNEVYFEALVC